MIPGSSGTTGYGSGSFTERIRLLARRVNDRLPTPSPRSRRIFTVVGFCACVLLLAWVVDRTVRGVHLSTLHPASFAWSLAWQAAYFVMLGLGWAELTASGSRMAALSSWSRTQALHLLPGGILTPTTRALTVEGGAKRKATAVATEALLQIGTSCVVAGIAMAIGYSPVWGLLVLGFPASLGGAWLAARFGEVAIRGSVFASCWYLGARIAFCISAVYAQAAVGPVSGPWRIVGVSAIAWVVGFVVIFAPGGLGVREAVYVSMLTGTMAAGLASAGAISARLSSTVGEFAVLLCVGWSTKKQPTVREGRSTPPPTR